MVINSVAKLRQLGQSAVFSLPSTPTIADLDSDGESEGEMTEQVLKYFFVVGIMHRENGRQIMNKEYLARCPFRLWSSYLHDQTSDFLPV